MHLSNLLNQNHFSINIFYIDFVVKKLKFELLKQFIEKWYNYTIFQ